MLMEKSHPSVNMLYLQKNGNDFIETGIGGLHLYFKGNFNLSSYQFSVYLFIYLWFI
jgi:hypothetical protein